VLLSHRCAVNPIFNKLTLIVVGAPPPLPLGWFISGNVALLSLKTGQLLLVALKFEGTAASKMQVGGLASCKQHCILILYRRIPKLPDRAIAVLVCSPAAVVLAQAP
jgi:hypothetical protein